MNFAQKIYSNDKVMVLTASREAYVSEHPSAKNFAACAGASVATIREAIRRLDDTDAAGVIIEHESLDELIANLQSVYHPLDAAGGVVFNEMGEVLLIYRRGKWDLPKGKLDKGERIDECALREVSEETGLEQLAIVSKICDTYHVYVQNNEHLLKRTAWYRMNGSSQDRLSPQKEENIIEACWVAEKDLAPYVAKTYEAVREVLHQAGLRW